MNRRALGLAAAAAYITAIVAANIASTRWGMVAIFPGSALVVSAGTYFAGAALGLRDLVQETLGKAGFLAMLAVGILLSFWFADPFIAGASAAAFAVSECADFAVYSPLRRRGWVRAVLASNAVGAVVDTVVFLWIAPFPLTGEALAGQLVGKVIYATVIPVALIVLARRAVRA